MNDRILPERILPEKARPEVVPGETNFISHALFRRLAPIIERSFLPFLDGEDVVFYCPEGSAYSPAYDDDRIWIILWSTPREKDRCNFLGLKTILGHPTKHPTTRVFPSIEGLGHRIAAEPHGPAVAQVFGRRIYILASIPDQPAPILEQLFEIILCRALEIFINDSIVLPESLYNLLREDPNKEIISALLFSGAARVQTLEEEVQQLRLQASAIERKLASSEHDILRTRHDVNLEEQFLSATTNNRIAPNTEEHIIKNNSRLIVESREEFEFMVTHPLLRYLPHADELTLTIYTRQIITRHRANGTLHDMGFYRMLIPILKAVDFRWFNLTRREKGLSSDMNHPHIYPQGHACLGNAKDALTLAMERGDLYGTLVLGLRFLTSCNTNDLAGKHLSSWPLFSVVEKDE